MEISKIKNLKFYMNKKVVLFMVLCIGFIFFISNKSNAADDQEYEAVGNNRVWVYKLDDDDNAIDVKPKDLSSLIKTVRVPDTLDDHKVISIASNAFENSSIVTKVVLHDNITEIGDDAFKRM